MDVLDQAPALKALKLLGEELSTGSGHRFFFVQELVHRVLPSGYLT